MLIGFGEIIIILLVLFVIVGPNDLPKIGKKLGSLYKDLNNLIKNTKEEINKI